MVGQNLKFLIATLASAACCVAIVANVALYLPFDVVNPARLDVDTYYELGVRRLRTGFLGYVSPLGGCHHSEGRAFDVIGSVRSPPTPSFFSCRVSLPNAITPGRRLKLPWSPSC